MCNDNKNKQENLSISAKTPKSVSQHLSANLGRILAETDMADFTQRVLAT